MPESLKICPLMSGPIKPSDGLPSIVYCQREACRLWVVVAADPNGFFMDGCAYEVTAAATILQAEGGF